MSKTSCRSIGDLSTARVNCEEGSHGRLNDELSRSASAKMGRTVFSDSPSVLATRPVRCMRGCWEHCVELSCITAPAGAQMSWLARRNTASPD